MPKNFSSSRKTASACILNGKNEIMANGVPLKTYFSEERLYGPILKAANQYGIETFNIRLRGGGKSAQAQATVYALSDLYVSQNPDQKPTIKKEVKKDRRQVEPKKVGHYKARKKYPYTKR